MTNVFRPWGEIDWLLPRINLDKWSLLGSLSFEQRCICTSKYLVDNGVLDNIRLIKVVDPPSEHTESIQQKLDKNEAEFDGFIEDVSNSVSSSPLLAKNIDIVNLAQNFFTEENGNLIIDVSSLPKRYFFPFIKLALSNADIKNLIITYSKPLKYTSDQFVR